MSIIGWYYLHTNGSLLYKTGSDAVADIRDSDLARGLWPLDPNDRAGAWRIVVEAGAAGAKPDRIRDLADLWQCTDEDGGRYAERIGAHVYVDGDAWCATKNDFVNLQESPAGFGPTVRDALTELAKELGYRPSKMWGPTFEHLLSVNAPGEHR